jgi:hypothetical protein
MTQKLTLPGLMLRLEGTAVLLTTLYLYHSLGFSWLTFAIFLLAPDLSMIGYLINKRLGTITYNIAHFYALPLAIAVLALLLDWSLGLQIALIWTAHIGLDRVVGYGLKYPDDFKHTHLNQV